MASIFLPRLEQGFLLKYLQAELRVLGKGFASATNGLWEREGDSGRVAFVWEVRESPLATVKSPSN